jgi:hypothetical protein
MCLNGSNAHHDMLLSNKNVRIINNSQDELSDDYFKKKSDPNKITHYLYVTLLKIKKNRHEN